MQKSKRILTAKDTLEILERGFYINQQDEKIDISSAQQFAENQTILYKEENVEDLIAQSLKDAPNQNTTFTVNDSTTIGAVLDLINDNHEDVFYLNFASARNPGGGVLTGAQAQEESIARVTGVYNCLMNKFEYYETNRKQKSCFYTNYMIYSPAVPLLKNDKGELLDQLNTAAILTAPAVNTGVVKRQEPDRVGEIETVMRKRIDKVLAIALMHRHETLVLGAWGCGVFQNNPDDVARYFKDALTTTFSGKFKHVVFAIYSRNERFITPFLKEFLK